jgi:hypothetical protein
MIPQTEHSLSEFLKSRVGQEFVRKHTPLLDDWVNGIPDAWDYEAVLEEYDVTVVWDDEATCDFVTWTKLPPNLCGWSCQWVHGAIFIGQTTEVVARKAAALLVSLWLRGVSASFAVKLMEGYIMYLEKCWCNDLIPVNIRVPYDFRIEASKLLRVSYGIGPGSALELPALLCLNCGQLKART